MVVAVVSHSSFDVNALVTIMRIANMGALVLVRQLLFAFQSLLPHLTQVESILSGVLLLLLLLCHAAAWVLAIVVHGSLGDEHLLREVEAVAYQGGGVLLVVRGQVRIHHEAIISHDAVETAAVLRQERVQTSSNCTLTVIDGFDFKVVVVVVLDVVDVSHIRLLRALQVSQYS